MKKLAIVTLGLFLLNVSHSAVTKVNYGSYTKYTVDIEGVDVTSITEANQKFQKLTLKGVHGYQGIHYQVGSPQIPVLRFLVRGDVEISDNIFSRSAKQSAKLETMLYPVQASRVKLKGAKHEFSLNNDVYASRAAYPAKTYDVTDSASVNGVSQKLVTIFPLRYHSATSSYTFAKQFSFKVHHPVQRAARGNKEFFAFIVGKNFAGNSELESYKKLKTQLGYTVKELIVNNEKPAAIRSWLKTLYSDQAGTLKYALIIGDQEDVPGQKSNLIIGVTDHYYRAIDTSDYKSDINGPDIGLGRIAVSNQSQLKDVLNKYTRYQTGNFPADKWLKQVSFLATDDKWELAEGTHGYVIKNYTKDLGYTGAFPNANMPGGDQLYAVTHSVPDSVVQNSLGNGRSIVNYSGHGAITFWDAPSVTQSDVRKMNSDSALPFVISNACITGQFTTGESFGETWQRHPYGASFFWGSMDNTYWDEDDVLEKAMYDGIYKHGYTRFSQITQNALSEHWKHYGGSGRSAYYWETYVSFGDPSMHLRHDNVREIQTDLMEEVPWGMNELQYSLKDQHNVKVVGARVSLVSSDGQQLKISESDSSGNVRFDISDLASKASSKDFTVNIEALNAKQLFQTIKFFDATKAFMRFENLQLNNRKLFSVSPGEALDFSMKLTNIGKLPSKMGSLKVELIGANQMNADFSKTIPVVASNAEYSLNSMDITLSIPDEFQAHDDLLAKFTWLDGDGQTSKIQRNISIERADLQIDSIQMKTPAGKIGIPLDGEAIVELVVSNTGTEAIKDLELQAQRGSCLSGVSGDLKIASLAPGDSHKFSASVDVRTNGACGLSDFGELLIDGTYESRVKRLEISSAKQFRLGVLSQDSFADSNIGLKIPDLKPSGVEYAFSLSNEAGRLNDLEITVDIAHSYVGDLIVELIDPIGKSYVLHNRSGDSDNGLKTTYNFANNSNLATLLGSDILGLWKLRISDHANMDSGKLNAVSVVSKAYRAE